MGLGAVQDYTTFGLGPVKRLHRSDFVDFLGTAWAEWAATGRTHDALPLAWPVRGMGTDQIPLDIDGRLGCYSMDAGVPITAGTWTAVQVSADVALTGAQLLAIGVEKAVFALRRPPGHHAEHDFLCVSATSTTPQSQSSICWITAAKNSQFWMLTTTTAMVPSRFL